MIGSDTSINLKVVWPLSQIGRVPLCRGASTPRGSQVQIVYGSENHNGNLDESPTPVPGQRGLLFGIPPLAVCVNGR